MKRMTGGHSIWKARLFVIRFKKWNFFHLFAFLFKVSLLQMDVNLAILILSIKLLSYVWKGFGFRWVNSKTECEKADCINFLSRTALFFVSFRKYIFSNISKGFPINPPTTKRVTQFFTLIILKVWKLKISVFLFRCLILTKFSLARLINFWQLLSIASVP